MVKQHTAVKQDLTIIDHYLQRSNRVEKLLGLRARSGQVEVKGSAPDEWSNNMQRSNRIEKRFGAESAGGQMEVVKWKWSNGSGQMEVR